MRIRGDTRERESRQHKAAFQRRFGGEAHEELVYQRHFDRSRLNEARAHSTEIRMLFEFLKIDDIDEP